jgi:hypothetical protein
LHRAVDGSAFGKRLLMASAAASLRAETSKEWPMAALRLRQQWDASPEAVEATAL